MKSSSDFCNRPRWQSALVALITAEMLATVATNAADFFTTNIEALAHFRSGLESSNRPVTVISFGDSMADSYRSPTFHLMNKLAARFGVSGYSLNNYNNTGGVQITNGASYVLPDGIWFNRYQTVPPGGATWWINLPNPGGTYCDRAGIFHVAHPDGGWWRLLISTNGGPWGTVLTLNGYSATPTGHLAAVDLPANRYRVRAETDTGTNYFIGPHTLNRQTNGIHVVFMDWGGISLGQVTNVPLAIREPIFAALQPDLLIWHMKETEDLSTSNRMNECEGFWQDSIPSCDVLYIGTPWTWLDTNYPSAEMQNTIVRNIALKHHRAYADLMQPTISYEWLVTNNFMADEVHLNSAGGLYCANFMWNDLGLFALGLNKTLSLSNVGGLLNLSYLTATAAVYRLEVSTNLQTWAGVYTNPIGNTLFATNFVPATVPTFYRLGLSPP